MKKVILIFALIILQVVFLTGCSVASDEEFLALASEWLQNYRNNQEDGEETDGSANTGPVSLNLTFPAGVSPNVFTTGWIFGASCTFNGEDFSDQVEWSGSGSFSPESGTFSRPAFNTTGSNTITLSVTIDNQQYSKSFKVNAVSPGIYACVGMVATCSSDAHGCPACPHNTVGPITTGSSHVLISGRPAARQGDIGVHAACCDGNTFTIIEGDPKVLINGRPAAMIGSATQHCGGRGVIVGR